MELVVDGVGYRKALEGEFSRAKKRIYFQCLSFEADTIGEWIAAELLKHKHLDCRLIVDDYSFYIVNDVLLKGQITPQNEIHFSERDRTKKLIEKLKANGIKVTVTHPVNGLMFRLAARQHRKITVIDDVAFVGGINLCEHNFHWHDFMVRMTEPEIVGELVTDFLANENREMRGGIQEIGPQSKILYFNGESSNAATEYLFEQFKKARHEIVLISPYIGFPFWDLLRKAKARGVVVKILVPHVNNWKLYEKYTQAEVANSGFEVRSYPEMLHMKALFIDGAKLFFGSANFEYLGLELHQEMLIETQDALLIRQFMQQIMEKSFSQSPHREYESLPLFLRIFYKWGFKGALKALKIVNKLDWPQKARFQKIEITSARWRGPQL